jgi:hypothetical protein
MLVPILVLQIPAAKEVIGRVSVAVFCPMIYFVCRIVLYTNIIQNKACLPNAVLGCDKN